MTRPGARQQSGTESWAHVRADGRKDTVDLDAGLGLGLPPLPGSAPVSSLAAHLALHALVFQSARAVAVLWLRWAFSYPAQPLRHILCWGSH